MVYIILIYIIIYIIIIYKYMYTYDIKYIHIIIYILYLPLACVVMSVKFTYGLVDYASKVLSILSISFP